MRPMLYMFRKEVLQVVRTREMLAILFMVPIIQMLVLGFALTTEVKHIALIISDQDNSVTSREIVRLFKHTDRFDLIGYQADPERINEEIKSWDSQMAIVIPRNFGRDLRRGLHPQINVIVDGIDGNTAGVALNYVRGMVEDFISRASIAVSVQRRTPPVHLITLEERMWFNLNLDSPQYMIPGIVVILLTIIPMMLSSMSLVREKEIGTLEQLMVTPLKKHQLLLGKLIPFLVLSFAELGLVLKAAQWIFNVQMVGSYLLLAELALVYLFATLGLGVFVSTVTQTQQQAMFISWFFMVFMILMSGFFIPIENMPNILQKATYLNPMRYFMYIIRDIFQKGSSLAYLVKDVAPLGLIGLSIFAFSVVKFQKRLG